MTRSRDWRRLGDAALRLLLAAVFLAAAGMKFAAVPFEVSGFARFGYPLWFMYGVGAAQLVGAALLWTRGLVAHGAALLAVLMVGAVGSHLRAGDPLPMMAPAAILLVVLAGLAWGRRRAFAGRAAGIAPARA